MLEQLTTSTNSFDVTLAVEKQGTNQVVVSGPVFAAGYDLQTCTNLFEGAWTNSNKSISIYNERKHVTFDKAGPHMQFRLMKP